LGTLTLPASGEVYIDAQIVIYTTNNHPVYEQLCRPLWAAVANGRVQIVSSELTLLETLVMPYQKSDPVLASDRERLWEKPGMKLMPISRSILKEAARLRALNTAIRVPDGIHAATALVSGCAMFLSNDLGFRRVPALPLTILDDVASPARP